MHRIHIIGRILLTLAAIAVLLVGARKAGMTMPVTPRSVAMADNAFPLSRGIDALTDNPAALAINHGTGWDLRIFDISSGLGSNALGLGDYKLYNGATLSSADKAAILAEIPAEGWRLDAHAEASAAALRFGPFGARLSGFGQARGNIDREMLELLFFGNETDRMYVSDYNSGEGLAAVQLSFSGAARLMCLGNDPIYGGMTVHVIRGLYYAQLEDARGWLIAGYNGVDGSGYATATIAEGGSGLALDWGVAMPVGPRYTLSVVVENAPGVIRWSRGAEVREYSIFFEGITAENYEDSLWIDEESATPIGPFTRSLPGRLRVGVGHAGERLQTALTASLGLSNRLASSTTPELGIGGEYFLFSFLPLRAGLTVGGLHDFTAGLGGGLQLGVVHLELAARTAGGVWPTNGRGATFSFAGGLHF